MHKRFVMTEIRFHRESVAWLKRCARKQLPAVQHSHVLEALASSLDFNTWASLNAALSTTLPSSDIEPHGYRHLSTQRFIARLVELGYPDAADWSVSFDTPESGDDTLAAPGAPTPSDRSRDPAELKDMIGQWNLPADVAVRLVDLIVARTPGPEPTITHVKLSAEEVLRAQSAKVHALPPTVLHLFENPLEIVAPTSTFAFSILEYVAVDADAGKLQYRFSQFFQNALNEFAAQSPKSG
jgi:hypothetical protein